MRPHLRSPMMHTIIVYLFTTLVIGPAFALSHSTDSKNIPVQIRLLNYCSPTRNCSNSWFHVQLSGFDVAPMFPFTSETTLQLYRDPRLNYEQSNHTGYNIFVIDQNGVDRVDGLDIVSERVPDNSKISFFRGQVVSSEPGVGGGPSANAPKSEILAIGYIDGKSGLISLQAFIRHHNTLLYLRPGHDSSDQNVHVISNESNSMGTNFFEMFQKHFHGQKRQGNRTGQKYKRDTSSKEENSCPMMIVADYSLFELMDRSRSKTVLFVHFVFSFGNDIFLNTKFTKNGFTQDMVDGIENSDIFEGYHHTLCKIVIEESQASESTDPLYNEQRDFWPQKHLETLLSGNFHGRASYCLAYLFSNLRIEGTRYADLNGFALDSSIFSARKDVPNVGVVSFAKCKDPWNLYCTMNFPHELGHSWGAPHDADSEECMPPTNGSYLMSFPFLNQIGPNNFKFSPCSIRSIYVKIETILKEGEFDSYCIKCGNGILEGPEECDEMSETDGYTDTGSCCNRSCFLNVDVNAQCSPYNHKCCNSECQVKSANQICASSDLQFCYTESHCDGIAIDCPARQKMPEGATCLNGGTCQAGFCNSTCPANHVDCECHDSCRICCQEVVLKGNATGVQPICKATDMYMLDGSPCLYNETAPGNCIDGWCTAIKADSFPDDDFDIPPETPRDNLDPAQDSSPNILAFVIFFVVIALCSVFVSAYLFRCIWKRTRSAKFEVQKRISISEREPLNGDSGQLDCFNNCFDVGNLTKKQLAANNNHNGTLV